VLFLFNIVCTIACEIVCLILFLGDTHIFSVYNAVAGDR